MRTASGILADINTAEAKASQALADGKRRRAIRLLSHADDLEEELARLHPRSEELAEVRGRNS